MFSKRWQALARLIEARFREFFREPEVIFWVYGFPLILAVGLGYAFPNARPKPPAVDVVATADPSALQKAAHLQDERWQEEKISVKVLPENECMERLKKGDSALVLIVHPGDVEYVFDPARSESVLARYWVEAIFSRDLAAQRKISEKFISEPGSRYIDFLLPGLIGMNIMGGGLFGVGFVLVDMRVRKLFKRLLATPMRHSDFLLSLLLSRLLFLAPEMASLLCIGWLWFGVPINGSVFTVLFLIVLGSAAFSGIGLLLGSRTSKTETMSGLVNLLMMPMYIFSGVFFSSKRFPEEAQPVIQALPLTQLNEALREVMLDGADLWAVKWRVLILSAYALISFPLALRLFKWR